MPISSDATVSPAETIILKLLLDRSMYGYEIIKVVNQRTDGAFAWKEGTLYPCLHRLEGLGAISSEWQDGPYGKPRKYYQLTRAGREMAQERLKEWKAFSSAMDAVLFSPVV